mmetsp:Transcript_40455/g.128894  ORF Transcript_40455/g.128894 Transcript_40455/m.128894 type:complete len:139 (+) Transcript_40455:712-1128(+)
MSSATARPAGCMEWRSFDLTPRSASQTRIFFHDRVRKLVAAGESREGEGSVTHVVLDACGINDIDLAGIHTLEDVHNGLKKRGVALLVASTKGPVRSALITSGTYEKMGAESFYLSIGDAVAAAVVQRVAAGDDGEEV